MTTTHLKAGYLRKNGVPYSENASLTEYYDLVKEHNGDQLMVVTIVGDRPDVSARAFIISSHFKKQDERRRVEADGVLGEMVRQSEKVRRSNMTRNKISLSLAMLLCAALPALAEIDLSGSWASKNHEDAMERGAGPNPDDWAGLPFNEAGRAKALSFSQSIISMPERICWFQTQWHIAAGPFSLKIWSETDPLTGKINAWVIGGWETRAPMTIWMDGRPHPSKNAPHDQTGFTTGTWNGDVLTAYTTHIKTGYIRRNGAPSSDQATITTTFLPSRRYADAGAGHGGPGLFDRAVYSDAVL